MRIVKTLLLVLLIAVALIGYRTWQFKPPADVAEVEPVAIVWDGAAVARFSESIRIPTISRQQAKPEDLIVFDRFQAWLKSTYPLTWQRLQVIEPLEKTLLLRWQGSDDSLLPMMLMAHQDVVPIEPGTESEWRHPPFSGAIAGGFVWGRGTMDDKVGVVTIFEATERLLSEEFQPERSVYLAFGHDEEVGGRGAQAIASYIESQGERLAFVLDEGGFVTKGLVDGVDGRIAMIGPAEKGYVSLKLLARGKGGHSSMPPQHTAVGRIAEAIYRIERNPAAAEMSYTSDTIRYLGAEAPLIQRMAFANLWLFEPLVENIMAANPATNAGIRTTAAATMMKGSVKENVLPTRAEAVVNFRLLPGDSIDSVITRIKSLLEGLDISIEALRNFGNEASSVAPVDGPGYRVLSEVIRQVRPDTTVVPRIVVGGTDARHMEPVSDASYRFMGIEIGPEQLAGMHGTNEHISQESFLDACKMIYLLLQRSAELAPQ